MKIVPAIDIIDGRCVRLTEGDFSLKKVYTQSVIDIAQMYDEAGFSRLHIVDLDAAREKRLVNLKLIEDIGRKTNLEIDYGGGIRTADDIGKIINAGVDMVNVGSMAYHDKAAFKKSIKVYGSDFLILSADCRDEQLAVNAWKTLTPQSIYSFIQLWCDEGINKICVTDIQRDGKMAGPNFKLYTRLKEEFNIELTASGGIRSEQDLDKLSQIPVQEAIVGKALLEGRMKIEDVLKYA